MTTIVVSQYEMEKLPQWQSYEDKIVRLVEQAKEQNASLLLLSEYAGLELASWTNGNLKKQFNYIQSLLPEYQQLFLSLAREYEIYIQPGTLPVLENDDFYRNRAYIFSPHGKFEYQDKIFLSRFELKTGLFRPAKKLQVFDTIFGKIGITISYDCEIPAIARQLTAKGATLLLTPSCTERISGLTRISVVARARAIENQCYVAHSCLIGKASWNDFIDINIGQSGIYCPADMGFPENGILAEAQLNAPMLFAANLSFEKLHHVREHGEMQNYRDMQTDMHEILGSTDIITMH